MLPSPDHATPAPSSSMSPSAVKLRRLERSVDETMNVVGRLAMARPLERKMWSTLPLGS